MKKIIALTLCAAALISFSACGKGENTGNGDENSVSSAETAVPENTSSAEENGGGNAGNTPQGEKQSGGSADAPAMITEDTGDYAEENVVRYTKNPDGSVKCSSSQRMEQFSLNMEMGVEDELLVIEYSEGGYIIRTELIGDGETTYAVRSMGFVQDNGEPQEFRINLSGCSERGGVYTFTGEDGSKFTIPAE